MTHLAALQHDQEWTPILLEQPPWGSLCRFKYELTGAEWTADEWWGIQADMWPYLWWKLTGIARDTGK